MRFHIYIFVSCFTWCEISSAISIDTIADQSSWHDVVLSHEGCPNILNHCISNIVIFKKLSLLAVPKFVKKTTAFLTPQVANSLHSQLSGLSILNSWWLPVFQFYDKMETRHTDLAITHISLLRTAWSYRNYAPQNALNNLHKHPGSLQLLEQET